MEKALYNKLKSGLGKACLVICVISLFVVAGNAVWAASFNKQINYQGKLSDELGITVVNGNYNLEFALYTSTSTGATAIWTETRTSSDRVAVTSGLFSVMLGEVAPISAIDWNQPLYLGVRVGGSGASPSWDLEMTPRKVLGTVPSAFEADKLDGLDAADFARANSATTMSTSSAGAVLTVIQTGTGPVVDFQNAGGSVFQVTNNGTASTTALTVATTAVIQGLLTVNGTGTSTFSSNLTVGGNSIFEGDILAHNITATGTLTALGLTTLGAASTTELSVTNKLTVTGQTTILGGASTTELTVANKLTVSGNSSLQNASTTNLSVSGNSYLTGNMGIGTAAPLVKLHIVGDMGADPNYGQIKIEPVSNNQGAAVYLTTTYSTTDRTWFFGAGNGSNGTTTFRIVDVTAGNKDRLNIDPTGNVLLAGSDAATSPALWAGQNGNVGIGTTSPSNKLEVNGSGYFTGNLWGANVTATGTLTVLGNSTFTNASTTNLTVTGQAFINNIGSTTGVTTILGGASTTELTVANKLTATALTVTGLADLSTIGSSTGTTTFPGQVVMGPLTSKGFKGVPLTLSANTSANLLTLLADGGFGGMTFENYREVATAHSFFRALTARGSRDVPASVQAGDSLFYLQGQGFDGTNFNRVAQKIDFLMDTSSTTGAFAFSTNNGSGNTPTERMRIDSVGNIGIGTTSPSNMLEVRQNAFIMGNLTTTNIIATGTLNISGNSTFSNASTTNLTVTGQAFINNIGSTTGVTTILGGASTTELTVGNMLTVSGNSSLQNASTTALSVSGQGYITGKLGLNTATPAYQLDVNGTARIATNLILGYVGDCIAGQALQVTGGQVACGNVVTGGASAGGGWVEALGIISQGTTTDQVVIGASTTPYAKLTVLSGNTATATMAIVAAGGQTANILDIYDSSSLLDSVITSDGKWGIGSSTPLSTLSVSGTVGTNPFTVASSSGNTLLTVLQSGNVGIGIAAPEATLDVRKVATGGLGGALILANSAATNNANTTAILFKDSSAYSGDYYSNRIVSAMNTANTGNDLIFYNWKGVAHGGEETLRIVGLTGNVGIGTTTPSNKLEVNGSGYFTGNLWGANITATGTISLSAGQTLNYNGAVLARASTSLSNYFFGPSGNLTMTGNLNMAFGSGALISNTTGAGGVAMGANALSSNNSGTGNIAVGYAALTNLAGTFGHNTAIGYLAGRYYNGTTGALTQITNSLFLGDSASALNGTGDTNEIVIGYNAIGLGSNSVVLGNDSIITTALKGNVGIGTTSPSNKLEVNGSGYFTGNLWGANITATGTLTVSGNSTFANASTTNLTVTGQAFINQIGSTTGVTTILGGASTTELTVGNKLTVSGNSSLQNASTTNFSASGWLAVTGNITGSNLSGSNTGDLTISAAGLISGLSVGAGQILSLATSTLKTDLRLNLVDNTSDANKPVSTAQQTALDLKVNISTTSMSLATIGSSTGQTTILGKTVMTNASTTNLTVTGQAFINTIGSTTGSTTILGITNMTNASTTELTVGNKLTVGGIAAIGTLSLTNALGVTSGGTGLNSVAKGDLLVASNANTLTTLGAVATGYALISKGESTQPAWGKITTVHVNFDDGSLTVGGNLTATNLTATGTLSVTGKTTLTNASTTNLTVTGQAFINNIGSTTGVTTIQGGASTTEVTVANKLTALGVLSVGTANLNDTSYSSNSAVKLAISGGSLYINNYNNDYAAVNALTFNGPANNYSHFYTDGTTDRLYFGATEGIETVPTSPIMTWDLANELVGIGSSTPWAKLSVLGHYGSTTNVFEVASTTSSAGATASLFVVKSSGNVGVGSSSPSNALEVNGNGYFSGNLTVTNIYATGTLSFTNSSATTTFASGLTVGANAVYNSSYSNLDINRSSGPAAIQFFLAGVSYGLLGVASDPNILTAGVAKGDVVLRTTQNTNSIYFATGAIGSGVTRLAIKDTGIVGVNTTNPDATLTVKGSSTYPILNLITAGGQEKMRMDASGNVGIGTTSPSNLLEVNGTGYFTGDLWGANITATGTLALKTLSDTYLAVNQSGQVIATTTPVGGGVWGSITGTLSSQSDLNIALGQKINISTTSMATLATLSGLTSIGSVNGVTTILGGASTTELTVANKLTVSGLTSLQSLTAAGTGYFGGTLTAAGLLSANTLNVSSTSTLNKIVLTGIANTGYGEYLCYDSENGFITHGATCTGNTPHLLDANRTFMGKLHNGETQFDAPYYFPLDKYTFGSNFSFTIQNTDPETEYFDKVAVEMRCHTGTDKVFVQKVYSIITATKGQEQLSTEDGVYVRLKQGEETTFTFQAPQLADAAGCKQVDFQLYSRGYFVRSAESLTNIPDDIANQIFGTSTQPTWGSSLSGVVAYVQKLSDTLNFMVDKVVDGVVYLKEIVIAKLTVEQGVTTKDKETGEYYCMYVSAGVVKSTKGKCEDIPNPAAMLASPVTGSSTASTTSGSVQSPPTPASGGETTPTSTASTSDLVSPPAGGGTVTGGVSPSSTEGGTGGVESVPPAPAPVVTEPAPAGSVPVESAPAPAPSEPAP